MDSILHSSVTDFNNASSSQASESSDVHESVLKQAISMNKQKVRRVLQQQKYIEKLASQLQ